MQQLSILFLAALLWAAPSSQLRAHAPDSRHLMAEETLSDATVQQVLDAAAPLVGESSASLFSQYQAGIVTITDLGPVRGGHRYQVSRANSFVVDLITSG